MAVLRVWRRESDSRVTSLFWVFSRGQQASRPGAEPNREKGENPCPHPFHSSGGVGLVDFALCSGTSTLAAAHETRHG